MEGLEISIIKKSKTENFFDLSSEFYKKDFLCLNKIILEKGIVNLGSSSYITDGEHGSPDWDENSKIKYITAENIRPNYIHETEFKYISLDQHIRNERSNLKKDDVLIYTVGAYAGFVAKAEVHLFPANIPRSVAIIRDSPFTPEYLSVFLNSKYGKFQTERYQAGNSQPMLALEKIKQFNIITISKEFQLLISNLYNKSYENRLDAKERYINAENLLLESVGLKDFQPSKEAVNIKSFKDSFANTGRLDAEYYQPKYEDYLNAILSKPYTFIKNEYIHIKEFIKRDTPEYNYIEIGDVNVNDGSCKPNLITLDDLPANGKIKAKSGDLLISKVRPYRGAVSIIDNEYENLVVSGAFTVLRINENSKYNNEVLKVILRSDVYKDWLLQFNVGTSYPVIKDEDIINLPIPFIQENIQHSIANLLNESSALKAKSEYLLQVAKRAVEIAIEENEEVAINYINNNSTF